HSSLRAPGHTEVCDVAGADEDCNPATFGLRDLDGDGETDATCCNTDDAGAMHCGGDCNDTNAHTHPGATALCDHMENDGDGMIDEGAVASSPELCKGMDDNCDGMIDGGGQSTYYPDADGDGFGDPTGTPVMACSPAPGTSINGTDCDDTRSAVPPGA